MIAVAKRGHVVEFDVHSPSCSSWLERKAMVVLSGDHLGFAAPSAHNSGSAVVRMSGHSIFGDGRRPGVWGSGFETTLDPTPASQSVLTDLSSATVVTV